MVENGFDEFLPYAHQNRKPINETYDCAFVYCLNKIRWDLREIFEVIQYGHDINKY